MRKEINKGRERESWQGSEMLKTGSRSWRARRHTSIYLNFRWVCPQNFYPTVLWSCAWQACYMGLDTQQQIFFLACHTTQFKRLWRIVETFESFRVIIESISICGDRWSKRGSILSCWKNLIEYLRIHYCSCKCYFDVSLRSRLCVSTSILRRHTVIYSTKLKQ